jgi:phosphatidylglycerophosphatase A
MSGPRSDILMIKELFCNADPVGKTALCLACWFGVGLAPLAPGTCGTLTAVPVALALHHFRGFYAAIFLLIFLFLAIWSSSLSERLLGRTDPPEVVIDEVAGYLVAVFLLPTSWLVFALGFVLFRVFDILKPFPIRGCEKKIEGGKGIVADDILAGIYTNLCIRFVLWFIY